MPRQAGRIFAPRVIPATVALALFAVFAVLYAPPLRDAYMAILSAWGMHPFPTPFLDADMVLSGLRCRAMGLDVFVQNPCDMLGRVFDYSPLWLLAAGLPVTTSWITPVGVAVDLLLIGSLLLLPPGRSRLDAAVVALGAVSTAVVFGLERGNCDVFIFALAVGAGTLAQRSALFRMGGYALALLAGLLKYYPMTLLLLAARERLALFCAVTLAVLAACAVFLVHDGADLQRALALIPTGSHFGDMFGAEILPGGLAEIYGLPQGAAIFLQLSLMIAVLAIAVSLSAHSGLQAAIAALTEAERVFLFIAAAVILGCFMTAQNIGYRALMLLLGLPSLVAMARAAPGRPWRVLAAIGVAAILFLMWSEGVRHWLDAVLDLGAQPAGAMLARIDIWRLRELAWWFVAGTFAATLACQLRQSEFGRLALRIALVRQAPPAPVSPS